MASQLGPSLPAIEARLRWNMELLAGFDFETDLGLSNQALLNQINANGLPGISTLYTVGTAEGLDLSGTKKVTPRQGFNSTPNQVFQVVPHGTIFGLKLQRVKLRNLPPDEAICQVFPSNLLLQQLPIILHLTDFGDGTPATFIEHYIYSCWFTESVLHYDVIDHQNTKLIENVTVVPGRMVTFDASAEGSATVTPASAVALALSGASQAASLTSVLLQNFNFFN